MQGAFLIDNKHDVVIRTVEYFTHRAIHDVGSLHADYIPWKNVSHLGDRLFLLLKFNLDVSGHLDEPLGQKVLLDVFQYGLVDTHHLKLKTNNKFYLK